MRSAARRRAAAIGLATAAACTLAGCFGFSGPNDLRRSVCRAGNVDLHEESGFNVGPIGVALANTFAPIDANIDGLSSAAYGEYRITCRSAEPLSLRSLAFDGLSPIVRIREGDSETVIFVPDGNRPIRQLVVMTRSGDRLTIVRAKGNLEKLVRNLSEGGSLMDIGLDGDDLFGAADQPGADGSAGGSSFGDAG